MILLLILLSFDFSQSQVLTLNDLNDRFTSMETKINRLESEVEILKSRNDDLEMKIELKEMQADVSYLMMEQVKLSDRTRAPRTRKIDLKWA